MKSIKYTTVPTYSDMATVEKVECEERKCALRKFY